MRRPFWILLTYWLITGLIQTIILVQFVDNPLIQVTDGLISSLILCLMCYAMSFTLSSYQPVRTGSYYPFVWVLTLAAISEGCSYWILSKLFQTNLSYILFLQSGLLIRFIIEALIIGGFVLFAWMRGLVENQKKNEFHKAEAERLMRNAELIHLKQQLQPHFLFNTLNSISALTISAPEQSRKMIQQLSDFLRLTLKKNEDRLIFLEEEMQHLQLYLEIEKVRFGHRLETKFSCMAEALKLKIPALLLQPLVENAIKFGLYDTLDNVIIDISCTKANNTLLISIENPYDEATSSFREGTGFGLQGVRRRLFLLYSRNDLLQTESLSDKFRVTIQIPQL